MTKPALYVRDLLGDYVPASSEVIIAEAKRRLARKYRRGTSLSSPGTVRELLRLKLAEHEREVFACLFLDNRHRLIQFVILFTGTIDGASIHPREVVKAALAVNAAAVICCHNHPSGCVEPSGADKSITRKLQEALQVVDIRILDHFIVGGEGTYSFAEHGLL
jgi:DNA repair protein RadC